MQKLIRMSYADRNETYLEKFANSFRIGIKLFFHIFIPNDIKMSFIFPNILINSLGLNEESGK